MLFQKSTFERVFDVTLNTRAYFVETIFGFEKNRKRHFLVTVPGRPRIEQGMTVIALLKKPDDWSEGSLLGWIDTRDGSLVCESPGKLFSVFLFCIFWAVLGSIRAYQVFEGSDLAAFLVAALFLYFACRFFYFAAEAYLARRALKEVVRFVELDSGDAGSRQTSVLEAKAFGVPITAKLIAVSLGIGVGAPLLFLWIVTSLFG